MEYAVHAEEMECMRLDMQMPQERARLAKAKAKADAAIAADNRAVETAQAQMKATAAPVRDLPAMQDLGLSSEMPVAPADIAAPTQQPTATAAANDKHASKIEGVTLFRGRSIAAVWQEW